MKKKLQLKTVQAVVSFVCFVLSITQSQAQNQIYWAEGFEQGLTPPCTIQSTSANAIIPNVGIGHFTTTSGTWYISGAYRTTGTGCAANGGLSHIRFPNIVNDANLATSGIDTAYVVTPIVGSGIKELHLLRARANRGLSIYVRSDTSAAATTGWTHITSSPAFSGTVTCADTTFNINAPTAVRLKIVSRRSSTPGAAGLDNDIDSVWLTSVTAIPVELMAFKGASRGSYNQLDWATASERNNREFVIERSQNGVDYVKIGSVKGTGTSNAISRYTFSDFEGPLSISYYRLRQIDFNEKETVSYVVTLAPKVKSQEGIIKVTPTATDAILTIDYNATSDATLKVVDLLGRTVLVKQLQNNDGFNATNMDVSALSNGIYLLTFESSTVKMVQKFEKK
jgi:hypothetical protein